MGNTLKSTFSGLGITIDRHVDLVEEGEKKATNRAEDRIYNY